MEDVLSSKANSGHYTYLHRGRESPLDGSITEGGDRLREGLDEAEGVEDVLARRGCRGGPRADLENGNSNFHGARPVY